MVKPTRGEQGKGITVGVDNPAELDAALARAREQHPEVLSSSVRRATTSGWS